MESKRSDHILGFRKEYKPRRAGLPSGLEPRCRSVRLRPAAAGYDRLVSGKPPVNKDPAAHDHPLREVLHLAGQDFRRQPPLIGSCQAFLFFSDTARRTTVPSSPVRAIPCPPRMAL
jgi:hypothetical protein